MNSCPLVWIFSHKKSLDKIESIHKRALRFLLQDYVSSKEQLENSGKCNMNIRRLRLLCIEKYKTLNDLNPNSIKTIFEKRDKNRVTRDRYKLNLNISRRNQATFGTKNIKFYAPKIWNTLPVNIKTAENVNVLNDLIKKRTAFHVTTLSAHISSSFLIILIKMVAMTYLFFLSV